TGSGAVAHAALASVEKRAGGSAMLWVALGFAAVASGFAASVAGLAVSAVASAALGANLPLSSRAAPSVDDSGLALSVVVAVAVSFSATLAAARSMESRIDGFFSGAAALSAGAAGLSPASGFCGSVWIGFGSDTGSASGAPGVLVTAISSVMVGLRLRDC